MKRILLFSMLSLACASVQAIQPGKLQAFDLSDVRLLDGPFKHAEQIDMDYILEMEMDRLLAPFLREAGLKPKAESYTNWENTGLDGHIGGHYVSALALMYAATGDERMKVRLDYMVSELKRAQDQNKNGYVGGVPGGEAMWEEVRNGSIRAGGFDLNGKWVPLYNIHKTYAGLRDAYLYGGNEDAKKMLIKLTDWMVDLTDDLTDDQIQNMLRSEHGGLNETFADAAVIVAPENPAKSKKYMKLAERFSHREILDPLLRHEDRLTGQHANTQIPKVIGYKRIADLEGNNDWNDAALFFWENVTGKRSISIGGNSVREHFHPIDNYRPMIESEQGPETCNTYNMLKLSKMLFLSDPDDRFMNFYERALYNHILSTQNPDKGGFVYFTPARPGHYRVYSQPHTCFWCCVGSGLENHAKYGELIYAHSDDELYVNLFIPSVLRWTEKRVQLEQNTSFPDEGETVLTINTSKPVEFTMKVRYPIWVAEGALSIRINDEKQSIQAKPGEYVALKRTWKKDDRVTVKLPMHAEVEQLPDHSPYYSFRYGPIVLAAKTGTDDMKGLFADDSRGGHIATGEMIPLQEMPILVGDPGKIADNLKPVPDEPLTFQLNNLYSPNFKSLELIPFFRLHESRYIMYWRNESSDTIEALQTQMAEQEKERQALAAQTVDMVYPGEQQPESDHFIESKDSKAGVHRGRHWRDAKGWFSYILQDRKREAKKLRAMYYGGDAGRKFSILINGTEIAKESLDGSKGDTFFTVDYEIPEKVIQDADGVYTVRFEAEKGSVAGGLYEVRLMK